MNPYMRRGLQIGASAPLTPGTPAPVTSLLPTLKPWAAMTQDEQTKTLVWGVLSAASVGASAYHGYKRTGSYGWTALWALMAGLFPVVTPAVALAQGFAKKAK